jgi:hypothetical protein
MTYRVLAALMLTAGAYGQMKLSAGADRQGEPRDPMEEQYRTWQNTQANVYAELRGLKNPCNRNLIMGLMGPLKKEARSYFDKRLVALTAYYEERGAAADATLTFLAGADPLLGSYEAGKAAQEKLLADDRERLRSLPPEAEQARQALHRAILMQEEHLEKIARNLDLRKADQANAAAGIDSNVQLQELKEQTQFINEDAELVLNNYDSLISRFDQACVSLPMGDLPPTVRPAPKKKP